MSAAMDQRPHQGRTRSKSTFSFKSDRSHHSSRHSKQLEREHLKESPAEKRKNHLTDTTKANPNTAMNEVQPIAAALEKPTLQSLRSFTHTDINGNIIAEPDLSNPTRPRWERPLDTIRSFEAAIDNEYKRRTIMKPEMTPDMSAYASRRSSYYGGHDQHRYSHVGGAYGNRQSVVRDNWENGHPAMGPGRARYGQRPQGDPAWSRYNNGQGVYPTPAYQQSRDTVETGASSGSQSEPYSNDPSDNSSIDRALPVMKPDLAEQYGFNGFGGGPQFQGPILQEFGNANRAPNGRSTELSNGAGGYPQQQYDHMNHAPPVPAKTGVSNVAPIKLGGGQQAYGQVNGNARPTVGNNGEKRKSWFKRRFSKD